MNKTKQLKILVLEDEAPLLKAIKIELEKNNFIVATARNMNKAISCMEKSDDLEAVWVDHYLLGKGSGLDFVTKLKDNERWKNIPVFVISNTATYDKVREYLKLGITKYYVKSDHRLDEIVSNIREMLDESNL